MLRENKRLHRRVQSADDPIVIDRKARAQGMIARGRDRRSSSAARGPERQAGGLPVVSAGSYILSAALLVVARPVARLHGGPPPAAAHAGLERRPSPPGRGDSRRRPPDLALRAARRPSASSTPGHWSLSSLLLAGAVAWRVSAAARLSAAGWCGGRGAEDALAHRRRRSPRDRTRGPERLLSRDHGGSHRRRLRPLGPDDQGCPRSRHLQLRLPLVPHALRGRHREEPLRHRACITPTRSSPTGSTRRTPSCCTRSGSCSRTATRSPCSSTSAGWRSPSSRPGASAAPTARGQLGGRRRRGRARVPHAGGARARSGEERPDGRCAAAGRDRDPGQRLGLARGRGGGRLPTGLAARRRGPGHRARRRDEVDSAGDGRRAHTGGRRACTRPPPAAAAAVVAVGRRSPAAGTGTCATWSPPATRCRRQRASGRSRYLIRSTCRAGGPTSTSSTTRPTPESGATISPRACIRRSACSGRWCSSGRSPAACWPWCGVGIRSCAGWAAWPCSAFSHICSRRSAPPAPRACPSLSGSTSDTQSRLCSRAWSCCPSCLDSPRAWQWPACSAGCSPCS